MCVSSTRLYSQSLRIDVLLGFVVSNNCCESTIVAIVGRIKYNLSQFSNNKYITSCIYHSPKSHNNNSSNDCRRMLEYCIILNAFSSRHGAHLTEAHTRAVVIATSSSISIRINLQAIIQLGLGESSSLSSVVDRRFDWQFFFSAVYADNSI